MGYITSFILGAFVGILLMCLMNASDNMDDYDKDTEYEQENV